MESACRLDAEIGETSGRSAAWLARYLGVVEVVGSNPAGPIGENPWFPCDSKGFFVSFRGRSLQFLDRRAPAFLP